MDAVVTKHEQSIRGVLSCFDRVLFRSHQALEELMPRLLTYRTLYFEAPDVMSFLGRTLNGNLLGDVVT